MIEVVLSCPQCEQTLSLIRHANIEHIEEAGVEVRDTYYCNSCEEELAITYLTGEDKKDPSIQVDFMQGVKIQRLAWDTILISLKPAFLAAWTAEGVIDVISRVADMVSEEDVRYAIDLTNRETLVETQLISELLRGLEQVRLHYEVSIVCTALDKEIIDSIKLALGYDESWPAVFMNTEDLSH
ncbi:MAG: hypothetical protein GKR90_26825 [Pseudomonadales bacterium]|nr:hypothetical protein [Pseudomonadales bacterium]